MPTDISFTSATLAAELTRLQNVSGFTENDDVYIALNQLKTAYEQELVAIEYMATASTANDNAILALSVADIENIKAIESRDNAMKILQDAELEFANQLAGEANDEETALRSLIDAQMLAINSLIPDITKFNPSTQSANNFETTNSIAISTANALLEGFAKTKAVAVINASRTNNLAERATSWKNDKTAEKSTASSLKSRADSLYSTCATTTARALAAYKNARDRTLKA